MHSMCFCASERFSEYSESTCKLMFDAEERRRGVQYKITLHHGRPLRVPKLSHSSMQGSIEQLTENDAPH